MDRASAVAWGGLWALVADPAQAPLPADRDALEPAVRRLVQIIAPAHAALLLAPVEGRLGAALFDTDELARARLYSRFRYRVQRRWAGVLADAGIDTVYLKGFANAHVLYETPEDRSSGDLDVLVRPRDLSRAIACLAVHGFRFRAGAGRPWGFTATASWAPYVSADGACNVDLHTAGDNAPADRALSADAIFGAARTVETAGWPIRVPSFEHMLALSVSNAAKDKFSIFAAKKLIDAIRVLRTAPDLDWHELEAVFLAGHLAGPARAFFALLETLGVATGAPLSLRRVPGGLARGEFRRLVAETRALYPDELGDFATLRREWLLAAEPSVALRRVGRRLKGLWRPATGVPEIAAGPAKG